jgi:hypothetical protein
MRVPAILPFALVAATVACGSGNDDRYLRGHGLRVASIAPEARVPVYEAALGASFELNDPALTLLLDPRLLPRAGGMAPEGRIPDAIESGLRQRDVIHGVCEPPITSSRKTPRCTARGPGYVVRFSDVFARGGDSVEVYLAVQKFDTPTSGASESLRFERAYQLVHRGNEWQAIREARVRETAADPEGATKS